MDRVINKPLAFTNSGTFQLGTLLRFTEPVYEIPSGTAGLIYESFQEDELTYCGVLLENGVDIGLLTVVELQYLAEILLQIPTAYRFVNPARVQQDFKHGAFKTAFSLAYPQPSTILV